jgi:hypothetical protein
MTVRITRCCTTASARSPTASGSAIEQEFQHALADIGQRLNWLPIGASVTIAG